MMLVSALVLAVTVATAPAAAAPDERTVTKASVYLVKSPSFLAPRISRPVLARGEKVTIEGPPKGAWYLVAYKPRRGARVTGYLHRSYMSDRPVVFKVQDHELSGKGAVTRSVNLAVPGFSEEVAARREGARKDLRQGYRVVDAYMPGTEAAVRRQVFPPDPRPLVAFAQAGRLRYPGEEGTSPVAAPTGSNAADPAYEPVPWPATAPAPAGAPAPASAPRATPDSAATPSPSGAAPAGAATGATPAAAPAPDTAPAAGAASDPSEWNSP